MFNEGSNFFPLDNPVTDEYGNQFFDSEGLYMAQRIDDPDVKKLIAEMSKAYGKARKARDLYKDTIEMDIEKRAAYMRNAVWQKFDYNPALREKLLQT